VVVFNEISGAGSVLSMLNGVGLSSKSKLSESESEILAEILEECLSEFFFWRRSAWLGLGALSKIQIITKI